MHVTVTCYSPLTQLPAQNLTCSLNRTFLLYSYLHLEKWWFDIYPTRSPHLSFAHEPHKITISKNVASYLNRAGPS